MIVIKVVTSQNAAGVAGALYLSPEGLAPALMLGVTEASYAMTIIDQTARG